MNVSDLKAFLDNKTSVSGRDTNVQKQLQEQGLRQAEQSGLGTKVSLTSQSGSQTFVGIRVFSNAFNQQLVINGQKPGLAVQDKKEQNESLFDFEEVAKNVLRFVGGAIKHAQAKGMDDDGLMDMFDQATKGVLKGIDMAKKDLAGMMNDEISTGIEKSQELINKGIDDLKAEIFGKEQEEGSSAVEALYTESVDYSNEQQGQITIHTRDGDEVNISFENIQQYSLNQRVQLQQQVTPAVESDEKPQQPVNEETQTENSQQAESQSQISMSHELNYQHFEKQGFAFSVKGELDEDEMKAISQLVGDAGKLVKDFFQGDVEQAFNKALELGFDDKELTGYAMQLSRHEKAQVIQTYEQVSHFNQDKPTNSHDEQLKGVKPVSQYIEQMLDVVEQAKENLQSSEDYENLINGLINKVGQVDTPELIDAINRFHQFNNKVIENLPKAETTAS